MSPEDKKQLRMDAHMEGLHTIASSIGGEEKVSGLQLMALCNMARVGMLAVFSELDGETGEMAAKELEKLFESIRKYFSSDDAETNGLNRMMELCAAMLGQKKFGKYIMQNWEGEEE